MKNDRLSRREMLRNAALGSLGLGILGNSAFGADDTGTKLEKLIVGPAPKAKSMIGVPFEKHETVRIGIIGTGLRGRSVLSEYLNVPGARITALCDVVQEKADKAKAMVEKAGQPAPAVIVNGEHGFE